MVGNLERGRDQKRRGVNIPNVFLKDFETPQRVHALRALRYNQPNPPPP